MIFEITETYTKRFYVSADSEYEALSCCDDSSIGPELDFHEGSAKELSEEDIKQCAGHKGDSDYMLFDVDGLNEPWDLYV